MARNEPCVILSEAKDHLATLDPREKILRFAQDDKPFRFFQSFEGSLEGNLMKIAIAAAVLPLVQRLLKPVNRSSRSISRSAVS